MNDPDLEKTNNSSSRSDVDDYLKTTLERLATIKHYTHSEVAWLVQQAVFAQKELCAAVDVIYSLNALESIGEKGSITFRLKMHNGELFKVSVEPLITQGDV